MSARNDVICCFEPSSSVSGPRRLLSGGSAAFLPDKAHRGVQPAAEVNVSMPFIYFLGYSRLPQSKNTDVGYKFEFTAAVQGQV